MAGPISRNTIPILQRLGITVGADQFISSTDQQITLTLPVGGLIGMDDLEAVVTSPLGVSLGTNVLWTNTADQPRYLYGVLVQSNTVMGAGVSCEARPILVSQGGTSLGMLAQLADPSYGQVGEYVFSSRLYLESPVVVPAGYAIAAFVSKLVAGPPNLLARLLLQPL